jgi:hypothetical protein
MEEENVFLKESIKWITDFLVKNDFYFVNENSLQNESCLIEILKKGSIGEEYYYKINYIDEEYDDVYAVSDGLNICWLIGFLTYNNLMDKNYKTL